MLHVVMAEGDVAPVLPSQLIGLQRSRLRSRPPSDRRGTPSTSPCSTSTWYRSDPPGGAPDGPNLTRASWDTASTRRRTGAADGARSSSTTSTPSVPEQLEDRAGLLRTGESWLPEMRITGEAGKASRSRYSCW